MFKWLEKNIHKIYKLDKKTIFHAIKKSITIKSKYVTHDEKEISTNSASRAILNFGHTFGHALETMNKFKSNLSHGEAISIGMIIAATLSYKLKKMPENELFEIINHIKKAGLPSSLNQVNYNNLYKIILRDKKNINGKINLILLKRLGKAYYARDLDLKRIKLLLQ